MTSSLDKTIDIKHYVRMFWRHKGIIILCTITAFCAALIALAFQSNVYESHAVLMMEDPGLVSGGVMALTEGIMQPSRTDRNVDEKRMAHLAGRIRSRPFLERVVRMLRMHEDANIRELARERRRSHPELSLDEMATRILVDDLQNRISFRAMGPGVYRVTVAAFSATNAQRLAWWISQLFVDISNERTLENITEAESFGQDLLQRYDERLRLSEQALERARQGLIEENLAPKLVHADNLRAAEALAQRIDDALSRARIRTRSYEDDLARHGLESERPPISEAPAVRDLATRMAAALRNTVIDRLAGEVVTDPGDWPPAGAYSGLRRDLLQQAEMLAAARHPDAGDEAARALAALVFSRIDVEAQQYAAQMLATALEDYRLRAASLPIQEAELARLEGITSRNRRLRERVEDYVVGADVRRSVETAKLGLQIEILDPARLPLSPSHPNRKKILMASILLGGLLGAGFAFLMETMDPILRSADDFARMAPGPVLGRTPLLARRLRLRRSWVRRYWIVLVLVLVGLLTGGFFLVRSRILHELAITQMPVQTIDPETELDEDY